MVEEAMFQLGRISDTVRQVVAKTSSAATRDEVSA
jgi:hypothetical protein